MENSTGFGEWLRQRRQTLAMSQGELAMRAGVTQQYISLIEQGRHDTAQFPVPTLCALADAIGLDPFALALAGARVERDRLRRFLEFRFHASNPPIDHLRPSAHLGHSASQSASDMRSLVKSQRV